MSTPTNQFKFCNHHHELTDDHCVIDVGNGSFVANKAAVRLLMALNELGLATRTHHIDDSGGFVSILLTDKITFEIRKVFERDADRNCFNGETELLIKWDK